MAGRQKATARLTPARRRLLKDRIASVPFPNALGIRLVRMQAGTVEMSMAAGPALKQYQGVVHGGALASLADTAATFAALTVLPDGMDLVTIEFKINFLSAVRTGRAIARAHVVRAGRRVSIAHVDVYDSRGNDLAATGIFSMLNIPSPATTPPMHKPR